MKALFKSILLSTLGTAAAFCAVVYTSCNTDKCKTIVCAHQGTCHAGVCACPTGYEGTQCETAARDKFIGTWTAFEKGSASLAADYNFSIQPDSAAIQNVYITNLYNYFTEPVRAYITGDSIVIPSQALDGKVVLGVGSMINDIHYAQYAYAEVRYKVIDTLTNKINDFGYDTVDHSEASKWNKN